MVMSSAGMTSLSRNSKAAGLSALRQVKNARLGVNTQGGDKRQGRRRGRQEDGENKKTYTGLA